MTVERDWLEPYRAGKPKQAKLAAGPDGLELFVPRRPASRSRTRTLTVLALGAGLLGAFAISGALSWGLVQMGLPSVAEWLPNVVAIAMVMTGVNIATRPGNQLKSDGRTIEYGETTVPLESIEEIQVVANEFNGHLVLQTDSGPREVADGLYPGELEWTAGVLRELVRRRRAQLETAGVDEQQEAARRAALSKLTER